MVRLRYDHRNRVLPGENRTLADLGGLKPDPPCAHRCRWRRPRSAHRRTDRLPLGSTSKRPKQPPRSPEYLQIGPTCKTRRRSVHVPGGVVTQSGKQTGLLGRILGSDKHADSIVNASRNVRDRIRAVLQCPPNLEVGSCDRESCTGLRVRYLVGCGTEVQRGSGRQTSEESRPDVDLFTWPACIRARRRQSRGGHGGALLRHCQGRRGGSGNLFLGCQGGGRDSGPLFR